MPAAPRFNAVRGAYPEIGEWLWTTREGAEADLCEELAFGTRGSEPRIAAPSVVASKRAPARREGERPHATFARQAFEVGAVAEGVNATVVAKALLPWLVEELRGQAHYVIHVWVPDSTPANPLAARANALDGEIMKLLGPRGVPTSARVGVAFEADALRAPPDSVFVQVCLAERERAFAGASRAGDAYSLFHGGRSRAQVGKDRPSRAAHKIEEAFAWLGQAPGPGDTCVDLGAAPGGWTWVVLERKARVIAVDPGKLRPDLMARRALRYVDASAFDFAPDEPVDWLLCDMAWRPLEVAQMIAKWGRRGWARILVSNFKLPMKRKAEMVDAILRSLEEGGWRNVRARQLYHDREEITVCAVRG